MQETFVTKCNQALRSRSDAQEIRGIVKARKLGVQAPVVYEVDAATATITMEHVHGQSVKEVLRLGSLGREGMA